MFELFLNYARTHLRKVCAELENNFSAHNYETRLRMFKKTRLGGWNLSTLSNASLSNLVSLRHKTLIKVSAQMILCPFFQVKKMAGS